MKEFSDCEKFLKLFACHIQFVIPITFRNDHKSAEEEFDNSSKVSVGGYSHTNQSEEIDEDEEKIFHYRIQSGYLSSSQFISFRKQITGKTLISKIANLLPFSGIGTSVRNMRENWGRS
jgi:hypothetical protein